MDIEGKPVKQNDNAMVSSETVGKVERSLKTGTDDTHSAADFDHGDCKEKDTIEDSVPDGGYGWFIVLGAFLVQITSFGVATSWGVMQNQYLQTIFKDLPNAQLQLSFVGTLTIMCVNLMGPFAQMLSSWIGVRFVLILGTLLVTLGLELASLTTQVWHLYLTQGVLFGCGASLMYVTMMSVAPQWFDKRRGLALGMVASGSGIGGLIMPFIMTPINDALGAPWTYRIIGFICLFCDGLAAILVKERIKRTKERKKLSDIIRLEVCKDTNYMIWCFGSVVGQLGYFVPYYFLPSYANYIGLTNSQGSAIVAVCSTCNFIGRLLAGYFADKIGKINTNIIFTIIGGLSSLLIWNFATSYGVLMAYAVIFGLTCGSYFALVSPIVASILGMELFPSGLSLALLLNMISAFGANIASAIDGTVSSEPYFSYKMFSGVAFIVGALILFIPKLRINHNILAQV